MPFCISSYSLGFFFIFSCIWVIIIVMLYTEKYANYQLISFVNYLNWFAIYQSSFMHVPDDGPGSLRDGCRKKEPLWIIFEISGTIELSSYLNVSSYKTVDGRGQRVKLTGKGLRLKDCEHVIICNLLFEGGRGHDVDGIQIKPNSKHIWIDRCSLSDYDDGLIDITRQSTDITVSRSAMDFK